MSANIRARICRRLEELGVDEDMVSSTIVDIVRGETKKETYKNVNGKMELQRIEITAKPEDKLRGMVVLDVITGGKYGIADESLLPGRHNDAGRMLSRKKVPAVLDMSIIANESGSEE